MAYQPPQQDQSFWEPRFDALQQQMENQRAAQQAQYRQTMLQPQYGTDSHSGTRYPGMMAAMYRNPQPTPQNVVAQVPQPTPTATSAYTREMATGGYGGAPQPQPGTTGMASPQAKQLTQLGAVLANLFGFARGA